MRRTLLFLCAATLSVAAAVGAYRLLWPERVAAPGRPVGLRVEPKQLDFGEVWETDRFVWRVRVHNPGSVTARVTTLTASCCPDSSAGNSAGNVLSAIPPGQSCEIPFEFDLRNSCAATGPQAIREVKLRLPVAVEPTDAAPATPWVLHGRVRTAVSVPVRAIDFGREIPSAITPPRTISIRALTDLSQLTAVVDGQGVSAELRESHEPQTWELIVGKATGLPAGKYKAEVKLCPITRAGEPATPVRIPVEFEALHDVQPDTPVVVLGKCRIGGMAEGRITLSSLSGRPFRVTGRSAEPVAGLEVTAGDDKSASSQSFSVRQRVTVAGDNAGRLRFDGVDADGTAFEVWVEVRSFGTIDP